MLEFTSLCKADSKEVKLPRLATVKQKANILLCT